ncbi:TIGR02678 family protein [Actinomycetospora sp. CA-084318]|uniref:TIGR02678 family protein n=1 Tax=Actinomycetospora sp. CA-084318 TaxID=3239892 RepID=UPI003D9A04EF
MNTPATDPQRDGELVAATRALLARPWRTAETDPELVASIRRHADALDAWFTQELNYRLVVTADTARLVKTGHVPADRPLRTVSASPRPFTSAEYTALALVLAATTSGPDRTSLRDLVNAVHSAAAEAGVVLDTDAASRRALVTALRWLIAQGMLRELDRGVAVYEHDADADALLEVRQDRMALLPTGAVVGAESPEELVDRARERGSAATAARRRLVEDPVVLAADLDPARFAELRRRAGDEGRRVEARTGLVLEARAEGFAALDVDGGCSDVAFPSGGTVPHAALLLVSELVYQFRPADDPDAIPWASVREVLDELVAEHGRYWSKAALADRDRFAADVLALLTSMRLVVVEDDGAVRVLPPAARYLPDVTVVEGEDVEEQPTLL